MTMTKTETRNCLACDKPLKGRSGKKFCDDYCRNSYNNQLKAITTNEMRNVNKALSKNRRILQEMIPGGEETGKTTRERLSQKGFLFKYITDMYTTKTGKTCYYCYEYGYQPLDNDWYLVVKKKNHPPH